MKLNRNLADVDDGVSREIMCFHLFELLYPVTEGGCRQLKT